MIETTKGVSWIYLPTAKLNSFSSLAMKDTVWWFEASTSLIYMLVCDEIGGFTSQTNIEVKTVNVLNLKPSKHVLDCQRAGCHMYMYIITSLANQVTYNYH